MAKMLNLFVLLLLAIFRASRWEERLDKEHLFRLWHTLRIVLVMNMLKIQTQNSLPLLRSLLRKMFIASNCFFGRCPFFLPRVSGSDNNAWHSKLGEETHNWKYIIIIISQSKYVSCEIQPARHNHQPTHQQGTKWAGKAWQKCQFQAKFGRFWSKNPNFN